MCVCVWVGWGALIVWVVVRGLLWEKRVVVDMDISNNRVRKKLTVCRAKQEMPVIIREEVSIPAPHNLLSYTPQPSSQ